MTTKIATITLPNRNIRAGEYGASYGHSRSHEEVFFNYFKQSKSMQVSSASTPEATTITISYTGKISQRNLEEIERFYGKGFLLDLVY